MINILVTPSDNYTMPCGVMFYSACVNNPQGSLHFFVVTDGEFTEESKNKLRQTVEPFDFCIVDEDVISQAANVACVYYPRYVFYRLLAFKFLPSDIDRILYLDCDIIIRKPLQELWNIDVSSYGIAGVPDVFEGNIAHYNRLEYPSQEGYFNAGVLLINLDYWRNNNVTERLLNYIRDNNDKIRAHDQDTLNAVLYKETKAIDYKWNFLPIFVDPTGRIPI